MFLEGDYEAIRALFVPYNDKIKLEPWRQVSTPLSPVYMVPKWLTDGKASYNLDVRVRKIRQPIDMPPPYRLRSRVVRELLEHSTAYLAYRLFYRVLSRKSYK